MRRARLAISMAMPLVAVAGVSSYRHDTSINAYLSPELLDAAKASPNATYRRHRPGAARRYDRAGRGDVKTSARATRARAGPAQELPLAEGVAAQPTGAQIISSPAHRRRRDHARRTGRLLELQPAALALCGQRPLAVEHPGGRNAPAIAVVDSGIQTGRFDFGTRIAANVNLSSLPGNSAGDGRGHGTFVAGIAAGNASRYAGASPGSKIVSIDVMDDKGMAMTRDVIAAADWILANKDRYNIRVANFSLHSATPASVFYDPLDRAVERLWFNGVVVVTAAGNYGLDGRPSGVTFAPGNDPFVITVGAQDLHGSVSTRDDSAAPWSAFGYTLDGFSKPELGAPGRYMVAPVPNGSTLVSERPTNVRASGYMELSGTSFAAPVVAGAAAQILARHPEWTPDQVKGALMLTARHTPNAAPGSLGVGMIDGYAASRVWNPPNPNAALNQFVAPAADGSGLVFDTASWANVAMADASWAQASWAQASWATASWANASWAQASWANASWASASWARPPGHRPPGRARPGPTPPGPPPPGPQCLLGLGRLRGQRRGRDERHRRGHLRERARRARHPPRRLAKQHASPGLRPGAHALRVNGGRPSNGGGSPPRWSLRFGYGSAAAPRVGVGESPDGGPRPGIRDDERCPEHSAGRSRRARTARRALPVPAREGLPLRDRDPRRRGRGGAVRAPLVDTDGWLTFLVLAVSAAVAQLFVVGTPRDQSYHTTIVFLIPGVLLLPPELIALLGIVYGIPEWLKVRYAWYIQAFNIANHTLNGLAAWGAVELVRNAGLGPELEFALSGLVAAVVFVGMNHFLLATMLHLARGHSLRGTGLFSVESLSTDFVLAMLGVALAALWDWNPLLLPTAVAPLLLIHRSLSVPALQQEARVDPKTGLFNARHFAAALRDELERAERSGSTLAVIMADLDLLRDINNAYGHLAGDAVLQGIADVFHGHLRHADTPARFGGEEFAILLPETTPQQALDIAERIRRAVAEQRFEVETSSEPIRATISIGVAVYPDDGTDPNEIIHQADLAVYRAKLQGRNRVLPASSEPVLLSPERKARLAAVPDESGFGGTELLEVDVPAVEPVRARRRAVAEAATYPRRAPLRDAVSGAPLARRLRQPGRLHGRRLRLRLRRLGGPDRTAGRDRARGRRASALARARRRLHLGQRSRRSRRRRALRLPGRAPACDRDRGRRLERTAHARLSAALQRRRALARLAGSRRRVHGGGDGGTIDTLVTAAAGLAAGGIYFVVNTGSSPAPWRSRGTTAGGVSGRSASRGSCRTTSRSAPSAGRSRSPTTPSAFSASACSSCRSC